MAGRICRGLGPCGRRSARQIFGVGALCALASSGAAPGSLFVRGRSSLARAPLVSLGRRGLAQRAAAGLDFGPLYANKPPEGHDSTVIWLHGLGDTGQGWVSVVPMLGQQLPTTRFLFPTAPTQPVTVNMGMSMPSWFDINSLEPSLFALDPKGLQESRKYVLDLVQSQIDEGIAPERIVLVGFSQGGAVSIDAALTADVKVGGVLMLSTFLASTPPAKPNAIPIHFFHGEADPMVPMDWSQRSRATLEDAGLSTTFRSYPGMQHGSCEDELADITETLSQLLGGRA